MTQVLAAIVTDAEHMPSLIYSLEQKLRVGRYHSEAPATSPGVGAASPVDGDVWGLGYYQDMHALTVRKPGGLLPSRSLYEFAESARSRILLTVVDAMHRASLDLEQPFRFRHWLFSAIGDFSSLAQGGSTIRDRLPGYIKSDFHDADPSALAFAVVLRELHARGLVSDPLVDGSSVAETFKHASETIAMLAKEGGAELSARLFLSNGRLLLASSLGSRLHYRRQDGLEIQDAPFATKLDPSHLASTLKNFRAVVLEAGFLSNEDAQRSGFSTLDPGKVLLVDRRMTPEVR
ncbi:MAG: hypothetical protein HY791_32330 [Deltaproteobacteria bacterium]|nr:hypothetical protein [Deltaproteobacteria bacterium]